MKRTFRLSLYCLFLLAAVSTNLYGQETGHYAPGITGIKAATIPPPGTYYTMHNIFYTANATYDGNGDKADIGFDLGVFVNAHRFTHVWKNVFWGANYAVNVIVPLVNTNISISAFGVDDNQFGVGDIIIDPMVLSWSKPKFDIAFGLGGVVPVKEYDPTKPAGPGKGFWTGMLTFGGTYYFDVNRTWTASLLSRYEMHSKKKDYDITAGNDFTFEYGVGKTIPGKLIWTFGVAGYAHWQLTEDKGEDVVWDPSVKDQVFSVGPEVDCFIPKIKLNMELRGVYEFGAIDRPQGTTLCLTLSKAF